MKRAVVTGGAGFIGSHVVDALIGKGYEVLVIDDLSTGNMENLAKVLKLSTASITVLKKSICDPEARKSVIEFRPSVVFHLAAQMNVRKSVEEPGFDATSNVVGTVEMLEAARIAKAEDFIFASTGGAIYGEQDTFPADEKHAIRPKSQYGAGKRAGELYLELYGRDYGIRTVAMRFANVYGPRQNPKGEAGVVAIFAKRLINHLPLTVNGAGTQTRDFVYVTDVVDACMLALEKKASGFRIFNVGRGTETSVNDIAALLKDAWLEQAPGAKKDACPVEHGPALAGEQQRSVISATKLATELGWRPGVDLREGLARTLESFISEGPG